MLLKAVFCYIFPLSLSKFCLEMTLSNHRAKIFAAVMAAIIFIILVVILVLVVIILLGTNSHDDKTGM